MKLKLSPRQLGYVILYVLLLAVISVIVHEGAHVLAALIRAVPFAELKLGFWGINPSVTLPQWVDESARVVIFYAGGLTTGSVLLLGYLLHWVRKYRRSSNFLTWSLGLVTLMLTAEQLASGYLEGRYHAAYIVGATSLFSPTDILTYAWMVSAVFFHVALCPPKRMTRQPTTE